MMVMTFTVLGLQVTLGAACLAGDARVVPERQAATTRP